MSTEGQIIEIRRHILENAIHLHENVISILQQEICNLEDIKSESDRL